MLREFCLFLCHPFLKRPWLALADPVQFATFCEEVFGVAEVQIRDASALAGPRRLLALRQELPECPLQSLDPCARQGWCPGPQLGSRSGGLPEGVSELGSRSRNLPEVCRGLLRPGSHRAEPGSTSWFGLGRSCVVAQV